MDQIAFEESIKKWCTENLDKVNKEKISTLNKVLWILYQELEIENNNSDISDIIEIANKNQELIEKAFFKTFSKLRSKLSDKTILAFASIARNVLEKMGLNKKKLKIPPKNKIGDVKNNIFPMIIKELPETNSTKKFILERFEQSKKNTGCKSKVSQKIMLRYWSSILKCFGNLNEIEMENIDKSVQNIVNIVSPIVKSNYHIIYLHHLFFCINEEWNIKISKLKTYFNNNHEIIKEKDGDKDFLTPTQQEDIWKECTTNLERLVIALLFTTGMRVGGLCNIKKDDIIDKDTGDIKEYGSTLEKGNKIRKFPIFKMVHQPLKNWLTEIHMFDSPYLFPNSRNLSKPRTTMFFQNLFKTIAHRAGYNGAEIHVHAIRHTVARNLLESGNTMDDIGKYLGHANPATTAKFYANLSVKETIDRMNTECIGGTDNKSKKVPQIPTFEENNIAKHKKKNKLRKLADINIGGKSVNEEKLLKALEIARQNKK